MSEEHIERRLCERHCIQHADTCECLTPLINIAAIEQEKPEPCTSEHVEFYKIKSSMVVGFVITWILLLCVVTWMFINIRDHGSIKTDLAVTALKIENIEKECSALKRHSTPKT